MRLKMGNKEMQGRGGGEAELYSLEAKPKASIFINWGGKINLDAGGINHNDGIGHRKRRNRKWIYFLKIMVLFHHHRKIKIKTTEKWKSAQMIQRPI